jgi:hypothetical protein
LFPFPLSHLLSRSSSIYIILGFLYTTFSIPVPCFFHLISFFSLPFFIPSLLPYFVLSSALFPFLLFTLPLRAFHQFFLVFLHSFFRFSFLFYFLIFLSSLPRSPLPSLHQLHSDVQQHFLSRTKLPKIIADRLMSNPPARSHAWTAS